MRKHIILASALSIVLFAVFLSAGSVLAGDQNSDPIPPDLIVEKDGLEWVWASPCKSGGRTGTILLRDGFRFATTNKLAAHPTFAEMGGLEAGLDSIRLKLRSVRPHISTRLITTVTLLTLTVGASYPIRPVYQIVAMKPC